MATGRYDRPVRGSEKLDDLSQGLPLSLRDKGRALGYGRSPRPGAKKPAMPEQAARKTSGASSAAIAAAGASE